MYQSSYVFECLNTKRYTFESVGHNKIRKVVEFTHVGMNDTFNLAFGDLREDGAVDDQIISNNGDIVKVLTTVINVLRDFIEKHPGAIVAFVGSTPERMRLYTRILRSYYSTFSKEFTISTVIQIEENYEEIPFDPAAPSNYIIFFVKRI